MPDGEKLLFNDGGLLYKIPVTGGPLEKLNTGNVVKNNNDHGISFDGKMLAISSSRAEQQLNSSAVWILPLEGGEPRLVTKETPSYWHGWAPGNKEVVVVAQRNGKKYTIYTRSMSRQVRKRILQRIQLDMLTAANIRLMATTFITTAISLVRCKYGE